MSITNPFKNKEKYPQDYQKKPKNPNEATLRIVKHIITIETYGTEMQHLKTINNIQTELQLRGFKAEISRDPL